MAIVMRTSPFGVCHFFAFLLSFTRRENTQLLYSAFAKQYTTLSLMSYYCWCEYVLRFLKSSALRYDLLYSIAMFAISLLSLHFIPVTMLRYLRQKQTATKLSKKKRTQVKEILYYWKHIPFGWSKVERNAVKRFFGQIACCCNNIYTNANGTIKVRARERTKKKSHLSFCRKQITLHFQIEMVRFS